MAIIRSGSKSSQSPLMAALMPSEQTGDSTKVGHFAGLTCYPLVCAPSMGTIHPTHSLSHECYEMTLVALGKETEM